MHIGIVVYSRSGHTLQAATGGAVVEAFAAHLVALGRTAELEVLELLGEDRIGDPNPDVSLRTTPDLAPYDALIIATSVRGGVPTPAMEAYLEQVKTLEGKRIACVVTHFFRTQWGAQQTLARMRKLCEAKGADVVGTDNVRWPGPRRRKRIERAVERLSALL